MIPAGLRRHLVSLSNPGTAVPDGDGGFTQTYEALDPPEVWVAFAPATARDIERRFAGTVISQAAHVLEGPYHPDVTTQTRVTLGARTFNVLGVVNVEERSIDMALLCAEMVA